MAGGIDMTSVADAGQAHLRVARPTDDLEAVVRFYRDGLAVTRPEDSAAPLRQPLVLARGPADNGAVLVPALQPRAGHDAPSRRGFFVPPTSMRPEDPGLNAVYSVV